MKNLANCTPHECIAQTVKIKKVVADWFKATGIMEIRETQPTLIQIVPQMSDEEKETAKAENIKRQNKQAKENLMKMFDAAFEKYPEKTLEVLAAACFTPIEEIDNHTMSEYFGALNEMINDENTVGFFISLARLANGNI